MTTPPRILAIAGSDSSGGAGIQADIKTVTMLGGYAMTAITAITAQNTTGVQAVEMLSAELVVAQIDSCLADIGADAIKIGMLGSPEIAHAVAERLESFEVAAAAHELAADHGCAVLGKGGHGEGERVVDRLVYTNGDFASFDHARIDTRHTHGTGCTLSSAIATLLAHEQSLEHAVRLARRFVVEAIGKAPGFGAGNGPLGHQAVRGG